MTAKTRYFLVGSVLVLLAGLSIGLVAYYGGIPPNPFSFRSGPAELRYVPGDAGLVAFANVRHVMDSDLRQRLRQLEGATAEGRKEFQDHTGIDVERDIDHVVAWIGGRGGAHKPGGLVLASGRFDSSRLEGLALEHGGRVADYQGKRMIVLSKEGRGEEFAMAFLEPGIVAIGNEATVRLAIERGQRGDNALANTELMKRVEGLSGASLWAVGSFDAVSARTSLPSELRDRMPPIAWFSASGRVNGGLEATVKAEARDEQGAENLRDLVRGIVALARMQADSRPAAKPVLPTFQLSGEGREVALT
ncbi:MAG TPA: hypothetical protein PLE61_14230, partial [Vicinamibacterales bacterium]|nr:hypothetical protein [Vicinamibacterales bacterium]